MSLLLIILLPLAQAHGDEHADAGDHMGAMDQLRDDLKARLGAAYDQPPAGLDAADATKGQALFANLCVACHGTTGAGDGPAAVALTPRPSDLTDATHARYYSDAGRVALIRGGVPNSAMPAFGGRLSDADLLDVYSYIASLRGDVATPAHHDH